VTGAAHVNDSDLSGRLALQFIMPCTDRRPTMPKKSMQPEHSDITPTQPESTEETAQHLVDRVLSDRQHPLVLFAREGCEFCWAAKRFFASIETPYRLVQLDSEEFQHNGFYREIRHELESRNGSHTLPQIYLSGQFVGGATDSFKAWKEGEFQQALEQSAVPFKDSGELDPYGFLSGWLHF